MIFYNIPWSTKQDIGEAYNTFMSLLSDDDFACFIDGDAMFLTNNFGKQIEDIVQKYPECGLFTGMTNRVKFKPQVIGNWESNDIASHRKLAEQLQRNSYDEIEDITDTQQGALSGVLILIKKSLWKKIGGFSSGMLAVDNDIHFKAQKENKKVYLMKGIYLYHWYRGGNMDDKSHLPAKKVQLTPEQEMLLQRTRDIEKRKNSHKQKKIIYSAITGNYDKWDKPLPHEIPEGWEYRMYSNNKNIKATHYIESHLSDVKLQRYLKTMPWDFFDFDVCLWIDGNTTFDAKKIEELCKYDFVTTQHPVRDCIYDEAEACAKFHKDTPENLQRVVEKYRKEGFPEHTGLITSHAILRRNTKENKDFCQKWWIEIRDNSHRDQMSFNYILWKNPIPIHYIKFMTIFKTVNIHR